MEENSISAAVAAAAAVEANDGKIDKGEDRAKHQRSDSCLSFMEISIEPRGIKSLKHLDSKKFKASIKRWAKAVVSYARQLSDHFGSSRR